MIGNDEPIVFEPGEVRSHGEWYDYESKYVDGLADVLPRADIDPADLKSILPNIILLNVGYDPFRVSVRLRGTRIDEFRPKGKWKYLHEANTFDRGRKDDYLREMEFVARHRRPVYARDWMTSRFGALCDLYAGIWPLSADGERIDMLVVIEDFDSLQPEDFDLG